MTWAKRRPTAAVALIYLLLSLAIFSPAFLPGQTLSASDYLWTATPWDSSRPADVPGLGSNNEQADAAVQFQPALQQIRAALPHIPRWDPYILSGRPLLGDPQSAVFSPFSLPAYVLPFWRSLAIIAALKLFVAALGTFLLARAVGMRLPGAFMAGLVFGFSLWCVTWIAWPHMSVWAFLPWLCLMCELTVRRPGPLEFSGLGAVVGLQFVSGHPASSYQVLAVVIAFWVGRVLLTPALRAGWLRRLLTLGAGVVAGTALAAVALIPFAELLNHSSDATARAEASGLLKQPSRALLGLFLYDYWGHAHTSLKVGPGLEERAYYVGALPLMLGVVALAARRSLVRIAVALVAAAMLAVSTGLPPVYDIVIHLPGFDATNNGRFAVIAVLGLAVLAGWGLDELVAGLPSRRARTVLAVCAAIVAVPLAIALADHEFGAGALGTALGVAAHLENAKTGAVAVIKLASVIQWAVMGAAALALMVLALRGRLATRTFVVLAVALVTLDLFQAGMGYNPAIDRDDADPPATPAIRYLQSQRPARFGALEMTAPIALVYPLPANVAMRFHLYDVRGYVIPTEGRYFDLWREVVRSGSCYYLFCTQGTPAEPRPLRALGLLGVTDLLQNRLDPPLPQLRLAYSGPDARIYRNPSALPRAFLAGSQEVVGSPSAARDRAVAADFPARTRVVAERPIPGIPTDAGGGSAGSARIVDYQAERVRVDSDANRRAVLVLTDNWYPGWKATVDGKEVPIERVDYLIRGVPVPAGRHRVEFSYEPASWRAAWIVSTLALLTLVAAAAIGVRRRRAQPTQVREAPGMFGA